MFFSKLLTGLAMCCAIFAITMQDLEAFIIKAKANTYVGQSANLTFQEGQWRYRDTYFGGTDFLGQEVVWHDDIPVWAMNYYGRVLRNDLIDGARAGKVIRVSLTKLYAQGRFLGRFENDADGYRYVDGDHGHIESFTGVEHIFASEVEAYRLDYHGGMIRA